ncbi:TPA: ead/Ea22-like family protein [Citrobacter freundii]|nr:ead/Ea22-like family protein [Citrobacter freundii]
MTALNKQALRGLSVESPFYLAECCNCGEIMPSSKLRESRNYPDDDGECHCPHCNADDCDIADSGAVGSEGVTAWNYQQKRIEALLDELEAKDQRIAELEVLAFSPAILDVISERQRQRSVEGWTTEHDDAYQNNELADAAACYAIHANNQGFSTPAHWPWDPEWWKQSGARRDIVKAGALILAEIERIDRAACKGEK